MDMPKRAIVAAAAAAVTVAMAGCSATPAASSPAAGSGSTNSAVDSRAATAIAGPTMGSTSPRAGGSSSKNAPGRSASSAEPPGSTERSSSSSVAMSTASAADSPTAGSTTQPAPTSGSGPVATESNPPGDIPDNQAYVPFTPAGGLVSVKIPEGWARVAHGSTTSFSAKLNRVEVSVTDSPSTPPPTPASVQAKDVPALTQQVSKFTMGTISAVSRAGQPAILLTYQGDSAPDEVTGKVVRDAFERYIFTRGRTRVDLTLSGPTNADNVDPWRIVSDSLKWLR